MTAKIYRIICTKAISDWQLGVRYSLVPWKWEGDEEYYKGYDDGGREYELPDGYQVVETNSGLKIFDDELNDLWLDSIDNRPVLYLGNNKIIFLKKIVKWG